VIRNGQITEHGSFHELMKSRGHLAQLVGEHVQIIDPPHTDLKPINEKEEEEDTEAEEEETDGKNVSKVNPHGSLTADQLSNRRRLSVSAHIHDSDRQIARHIEDHQMDLLSVRRDSFDAIKIMEHNRMSIVTEHDEDTEVVPDDAEPMKLVLDDQSIFYKKSPLIAYLRSGYGAIATVSIFLFFFLVHGVRIGSGKLKHIIKDVSYKEACKFGSKIFFES
jgi:hypothetical protein